MGCRGGLAIPTPDVHWVSAGLTHVGKTRKLNEDALLDAPGKGLWAVADGMGGHAAGDFASASLVEALDKVAVGLSLDRLLSRARRQLERVNTRLVAAGRKRQVRIIGSTIVVLVSCGREAAVLWAGDSRVYRLSNGALELLTLDHSRIQELINSGRLTPDEAEQHPEANVITRAVGVADKLELDSKRFDVGDGDTFLLCSDGLSRYVDEASILAALGERTCTQACTRLIDAALQTPARDNVTVVVIRAATDDSLMRTRLRTEVDADLLGGDPTERKDATTRRFDEPAPDA